MKTSLSPPRKPTSCTSHKSRTPLSHASRGSDLLRQKYQSQVQSCRLLNKTKLTPSKSEASTARITPVTNRLNKIKAECVETKPAQPVALKTLIKIKNTTADFKVKIHSKPACKSFIPRINPAVYNVPDKLLTNSEIKKIHKEIHKAHMLQTFYSLKLIADIPRLTAQEIAEKVVFLARKTGCEKRKTVVFDLDETLVHCEDESKAQAEVSIKFPTGDCMRIGINLRPYARECLEEASKFFEVIVFTASHKNYADAILDWLDPQKRYIHHRLYRENCVLYNGMHIKDLRVLGNREIKDIVIVDNAVHSFAFHIDNGIPIITWHNDRYDRELFKLIDYLKLLADAADICSTNRQTFKLRTFCQDFLPTDM